MKQIVKSYHKNTKSLKNTFKRIDPSIDPFSTPRIISNHSLMDKPSFIFVAFGKDNSAWVSNYFCQLRIPLALQLSNHGWHGQKLW